MIKFWNECLAPIIPYVACIAIILFLLYILTLGADDGTKKSLKGLLCVIKTGPDSHVNQYMVKEECTPEWENKGLLQVIYEDGKFYNQTTFTEIRERLKQQ